MVLSRPCSAPLATDNVARRRRPVKRKENSRDVQTACGNVKCVMVQGGVVRQHVENTMFMVQGGGGGVVSVWKCTMFMVQGVY